MKKINLLIVPTGGMIRDGIVLSILDYVKHINKDKFNLIILSTLKTNKELEQEFINSGCKVIEMPSRKKKIFKYRNDLKKIIIENKIDIIHVHGSSSLMAIELLIAKKCNVPVRIAHSRNTRTEHKILDMILYPLFKNSYTVGFACGIDAGNFLFRKNEFTVFHNGKDLTKFKFNNVTRRKIRNYYKIGNKVAFGHVGTFNAQKNHEFIIDIFRDYHKENPESILYLIGLGYGQINNQRQIKIKNLVHEYKLDNSVVFLGNVDNVYEIISGMDIMLLPSLFEGLPNVVLEWQASGLPCLVSNTITTECKVYDNVEFLPIDDGTKPWVEAINDILKKRLDRNVQSNIGCQSLINNGFEIESNTKKLEQKYIELINKN